MIKRIYLSIFILFIVITAGLFRSIPLLVLQHTPYQQQEAIFKSADGGKYFEFTHDLLKDGIPGLFDKKISYKTGERSVTSFISPAYPFLLWGIFKFAGFNFQLVALLQICIDLLTLLLIFLITKKVIKSEVFSLFSCVFYVFNSQSAIFAASLMPYTLFTFLLTLIIYVFIGIWDTYRLWKMALLGFLVGFSTLLKPGAMIIGPCLIIIFITRQVMRDFRVKRVLQSIIFPSLILIGAFMITLFPWQMRNWLVYDNFSVSTQPSIDMLLCRACYAHSLAIDPYDQTDIRGQNKEYRVLYDRLQKQIKLKNPFERAKIFQAVAISTIQRYPHQYLIAHLRGLKHLLLTSTFFESGSNRSMIDRIFSKLKIDARREDKIGTVFLCILFIQYFFILVGLLIVLLKRNNLNFVMLFFIFSLYVLTIGPIGYQRYLYPISPIIAVLTGAGLFELFQVLISKGWGEKFLKLKKI